MNAFFPSLLFALAVPFSSALADWHQTSGPSGGNTTALFARGETLFVGNYNYSMLGNNQNDVGTVYRSTDHGQHWTASGGGLTGVAKAFAANGTTLFVATTDGVFRSTDDGVNWSLINGTSQFSPQKLLYANGVLYVGSSLTGVYRSTNNGDTFVASSQGLPQLAAISAMATVGNTLFIGVGSLYPNPEGVFRSTDGGVILGRDEQRASRDRGDRFRSHGQHTLPNEWRRSLQIDRSRR